MSREKYTMSDLGFDYKKALKQLNLRDKEVKELREKIKKLEHVPKTLSLKKLLCFLNACNGSDDAANVIATYYKIRQTCPSIFSNRDPLSAQLQQCLSSQYYFHLPNTPKGYSVIYHCLSSPKASDYVFDEACKTFFMTIDSLLHSRGPSNGLIIIFDMRNVGLRHLLRPKIDSLKTYFTFLHDALPAKLSAMHIVNCVSFFDMVMSLIRPCMKNEVVEKINLHHGNNYKKLQEVVPASGLPSDFGGELESTEKLHHKHCKELERLQSYFIEDENEATLKK